ncbi:hypothetical protein K492DRAFT_187048 [Lichtheimia hyalospora FSU 10163]|nr:hypothetical protein K492DRAFT_187048 [Lichtheimia hyalospora FSU 10163]
MHTNILVKLAFATILALLLLSRPTVADFDAMVNQALEASGMSSDMKAIDNKRPFHDNHPVAADAGATRENTKQPPSPPSNAADTGATMENTKQSPSSPISTTDQEASENQQQQPEDQQQQPENQQQQQPDLGSIGKNLKNPNANSTSLGDCLSGCAKIVDSLTKGCKQLCDQKKGSCYDECDQNIKTTLDGCKEDCKTQKNA